MPLIVVTMTIQEDMTVKNDGKSEDKKKGDHYDWSNSFVCWNNAGGVSQWMHGVLLFPCGFLQRAAIRVIAPIILY